MRDQGPSRRFEGDSMALLDLRKLRSPQVSSLIRQKMNSRARLASSDDRVVKILEWYALSAGTGHIIEGDAAHNWRFVEHELASAPPDADLPSLEYPFALQPIVDPMRREITSFEFLIRSQSGGSPEQLFTGLAPAQRYLADLESKASAFQLARRLSLDGVKLSVNLFPMSLIGAVSAVD
ncbi:hypothetical protein BTL47_18025 [Bordetella holmesii]|nr:hypothetical protein H558_06100 [Bordetella holmesii H558]AUL21147.1 hypothetical protein BTL46_17985 [Bordetella holmesii]AUL27816.1 hypothetical protein BTL49_18095 [Bordetella holmesii]AUL34484.1 hypothetical protein BTL51_18085 [Bordetella holmesii]AUL37835.1 hypothetical protein BTL52_18060 [Bordetella holmesii]